MWAVRWSSSILYSVLTSWSDIDVRRETDSDSGQLLLRYSTRERSEPPDCLSSVSLLLKAALVLQVCRVPSILFPRNFVVSIAPLDFVIIIIIITCGRVIERFLSDFLLLTLFQLPDLAQAKDDNHEENQGFWWLESHSLCWTHEKVFTNYQEYTAGCVTLADRAGVDMNTIKTSSAEGLLLEGGHTY